jgi:hypothetical protein
MSESDALLVFGVAIVALVAVGHWLPWFQASETAGWVTGFLFLFGVIALLV